MAPAGAGKTFLALHFILNVLSHDMVELGGLLRELHYRTSPTMQRTAVITDAA